MRVDVVSDTHAHLSDELLCALEGADAIVHAGDMTSDDDRKTLCALAPVYQCLGNNDICYHYGSDVTRRVRFSLSGIEGVVAHYYEDLEPERDACRLAICGHTHRPHIETVSGILYMNPGSPTYPRTTLGPTIGRLMIEDEQIISAEIIQLGNA